VDEQKERKKQQLTPIFSVLRTPNHQLHSPSSLFRLKNETMRSHRCELQMSPSLLITVVLDIMRQLNARGALYDAKLIFAV
jgi:hypothetical protein